MHYYNENLINSHMYKKTKRIYKINLIIKLKLTNKWNLISPDYNNKSLIIEDNKINLKISKDKMLH